MSALQLLIPNDHDIRYLERKEEVILRCPTRLVLDDVGAHSLLTQIKYVTAFTGGDQDPPIVQTYKLPRGMLVLCHLEDPQLCALDPSDSDGNGERLTYALAGDLAKIAVPDDAHWSNKAIIAHLAALPVKTPIFLYWE